MKKLFPSETKDKPFSTHALREELRCTRAESAQIHEKMMILKRTIEEQESVISNLQVTLALRNYQMQQIAAVCGMPLPEKK